jgi:parvulin-like peptidyl-prolyl isomerase/Tfp pilus assembly protein PilF
MQRFFKKYQKAILWVVVGVFVISIGFLGLQQAGIFQSRTTTDDEVPEVVAVVNDREISQQEYAQAWVNVFGYYQSIYQQSGQDLNSRFQGADGRLFAMQLQNEALDGIIRQAIYDAAAAERGIVAPRSEVNAQYEDQYNQYLSAYTEEEIRTYASGLGMSLAQFQQSMRDGIAAGMRNEELREEITADIAATDEEIEEYFETNIARYDQPEQVEASHILVEERDQAVQLRQQLLEGADFALLAEEYSIDTGSAAEGGSLGWFGRGRMVPAFEEAAFSLQPGELSDIVETQFGFHIIEVSDRREAHTPTLDEIRDEVVEDATQERKQEAFRDWYDERLADAEVTVNLPMLAAYRKQVEDVDLGIAAYRELVDEGYTEDPYLQYYLGRLYERKITTAVQERDQLQAIEEAVRVEHILLERRRQAQEILDQVIGGQGEFGRLAAEFSLDEETAAAGGDLGWVARGEMPEAFEEAVFAMETDADPQIVETDDGFHVVRVIGRRPGPSEDELARIEELQAEIEEYRGSAREAYNAALDRLVAENRTIDGEFLQRIRTLDPENVEVLYYMALSDAETGNTASAMSLLREATNKDPEYFEAYVLLGDLAAELGILTEAIGGYEAALDLRPSSISVLTKLAETHLEAGNLDEAATLLDELGTLDPESVRLKQALGDLQFERLLDAVEQRDALLARDDRSAEEDARLEALEEEIESLYALTVEHYEDASTTSTSTALMVRLGRAHLAYGARDAAEQEFSDALRQSPYTAEAYEGMARVNLARGDRDLAVENLSKAFLYAAEDGAKEDYGERLVELTPEDVEVRLRLAQVYARQYKWSAAIRQYAKVIEVQPEDIETYELIAEAYRWRTEYDTAIDYLRRGLEYATNNAERIVLLEKIIEVDRSDVGTRNPLTERGLDARIDLARLYIERIEPDDATEQLDLLVEDAPEYRSEEIEALREEIEALGSGDGEILELDTLDLPAPSSDAVQTAPAGDG